MNDSTVRFRPDESFARDLDEKDPLREYRAAFLIPTGRDGKPARYFCGNSLGLQPLEARRFVEQELREWATRAVAGHFQAETPWYTYQEVLRGPVSRLVGALEHEVVLMNTLTVNLHLLMVTFYRPTPRRFKILVEDPIFPSDLYAVNTQIRHHGLDPAQALIQVSPPRGETLVRAEDIEAVLEREGDRVALVLLGGVNFLTGQLFDLERITRTAHAVGAVAGFDLAHAAGNVPLRLHDWDVDFAAWCSYKYLNGGPGAMAGAFVHERHASDTSLPRFGGWWGNDDRTRFRMEPEFVPVATADGWQLSTPSILSLAPLRASLELFDRAGMEPLRAKSVELTSYLEYLLTVEGTDRVRISTPREPARRGCQLSLEIEDARRVQEALEEERIICDFREPNVVRAAPAPLYNTYHEVWTLAQTLNRLPGLSGSSPRRRSR
jgi:kynureninase